MALHNQHPFKNTGESMYCMKLTNSIGEELISEFSIQFLVSMISNCLVQSAKEIFQLGADHDLNATNQCLCLLINKEDSLTYCEQAKYVCVWCKVSI